MFTVDAVQRSMLCLLLDVADGLSITQVAMDVQKIRAYISDLTCNPTFYVSTNATARSTRRSRAVRILN